MTINIIIAGFCSLSQAIAFYVTFRLRARGRLDDLFISLLKKSRKSFPFKTGWKSNERMIVLHQQINKQWNNQPGIYNGFQIEQTLSITKVCWKDERTGKLFQVSASSLISFGVSVSKIGTIIFAPVTGARDFLPPRVWVIWVSGRVAICQR